MLKELFLLSILFLAKISFVQEQVLILSGGDNSASKKYPDTKKWL